MYKFRELWYYGLTNPPRRGVTHMIHAIQSIDPVYIVAVPAVIVHSVYQANRRAAARVAAMRRHPSSRG